MPRRVVVDATSIGGRLGGIGVYGVNLVRTLAGMEADLDITIVLNETARPHFLPAACLRGVEVRWVGSSVSPDRGSLGHLRRWLHANRLALQQRDALIFATSQIEAAVIGRPRVVMVHDLIPLRFPQWHPRQRFFFRHVLGAALRGAAAVVVPSRATRDRLLEHYGLAAERIRVIPHGVSVPLRAGPRGGPGREPLILGFGGSSPVKNVQTLIHAFRRVESQIPHRIVIVGDRRRLGRVSETGASPRVAFLSWVSEEEKLALLDRAAVLVCPSFDEGFGFPALEAMARGCPVVASRAGSLPEVCADAAIYIAPQDAEGIAAALLGVLSPGRLRDTLVEKGARRATSFGWNASAAEHLRLFREVLAAGGRGRRASRWPAAALDAAPPSPGVAFQGRDRP
jgi:glycosyltransferase involved in cell wall biosynthesis